MNTNSNPSNNPNNQLTKFRARTLDACKAMPVLRTEDVPDLPDFATINRAVPQMPTGMEKEEECEHHLQRAISAQQAFGRAVDHVIPTPEVYPVDDKHYDELYPPTYKIPRQLIHVQLPSFEQDHPDYDIDSEDEEWLIQMKPLLNLSETKFEEMIECLEKNSGVQKVIELNEAKALLIGVDESVQISVYDYWLNKKLNVGKSLIPSVKTEKRDGTSGNNPYIAFRRRTEKMQTRKNRKNDESSYEKMLKLKRDFLAVRNLMSLVQKRESIKYNLLKIDIDILDSRYELKDFNSHTYNELTMASQITKDIQNRPSKTLKGEENVTRKKRTKRPKNEVLPVRNVHDMVVPGDYYTSEDDNSNDVIYQSSQVNNEPDDADNPDGMFSFKRKKGCHYHAPLDKYSGWPWESPEEGGLADKRFRYNFTSLSCPPNYFVGFTRRRIGRGGRILFDRIRIPIDVIENFNDDDDDDDDDDPERIHYKPLPNESDVTQESIEFNTKHFDDDSVNFLNNQLRNCLEESSIEKQFYQYNERDLFNFIEKNQQAHVSSSYNSSLQSERFFKTNNRLSKSAKVKPTNLFSSFVKSIDVDISNTMLNCISNLETATKTSDHMKQIDKNELKDSSFSPMLISENKDPVNDIYMEQINNFLNVDDERDQRIQKTNKLENFTSKSSNYSAEIISQQSTININNGSDHFNFSDKDNSNKVFPHEPSNKTTTNTECPSSSSSETTNLNQNISSFSSPCRKLKLNNQSSSNNLHTTDVT